MGTKISMFGWLIKFYPNMLIDEIARWCQELTRSRSAPPSTIRAVTPAASVASPEPLEAPPLVVEETPSYAALERAKESKESEQKSVKVGFRMLQDAWEACSTTSSSEFLLQWCC